MEYLRGDAQAYFNTGLTVDDDEYTFEGLIRWSGTLSTSQAVFGAVKGLNGSIGVVLTSRLYYKYGEGNAEPSVAPRQNANYQFSLSSRRLVLNGSTYTSTQQSTLRSSVKDLVIFARSYETGGEITFGAASNFDLMYFRIYHDGTLIHDYIPVSKDGEGCLYDQTTETLLRNEGPGAFIVGPRK